MLIKKIVSLLYFFFFLIFLFSPRNTWASFEKIDYPNNKFGIHLAIPSEEDLEKAANLVNSSGGDWGYVTLVIEEKDREKQKWQDVFNKMRQLHLIPIIRLATSLENSNWKKPEANEAKKWAEFLDSLNWVVKNRYIILFNEPNHGAEWGGKVNPQDYGQTALTFAKTLKEKNPDFFIMLAGFDSAAPSQPPKYEEQEKFLRQMFFSLPNGPQEIFQYIDSWVSHSYPNHGFVGLPTARGRNSVRNYQWELSLLKNLGVKKNLPVFITETGWPHQEGLKLNPNFYSAEKVANYFQIYFKEIIKDPQVIAITPFILNYQGEPFDHFSWQKLNSKDFYPQYEAVAKLTKQKGKPKQEEKLKIINELPEKIIKKSTYQVKIKIRNEGQAIWENKEGYQLDFKEVPEGFDYFFSDFSSIAPFEEKTIWLHLKTGERLGKFNLELGIAKNGKIVTNFLPWNLEIVPQVSVKLKANLLFKKEDEGKDFRFLIYNPNEEIVFEISNINFQKGVGEIKGINNLIIGERYRLVLLKPFYLPRQAFLTITQEKNEVIFETMLPLDFNLDGKFSFADIIKLFRKPKLLKLWWFN